MITEGEELKPATFKQQQNKVIVFWSKLDIIKCSLKGELNALGLEDEAIGVYNFLEMQLEGNLSDKKEDDEDWFTGLSGYKTKSKYMKGKASTRISNYYQTISEALKRITNHDGVVKEVLSELEEIFKKTKEEVKEKGKKTIFESICDNGKFKCEGPNEQPRCPFHHIINPYRTLQGRLEFSAWDLDHRIEQSFVIKELQDAIENNPEGRKINTQYFYDLMLTTKNLKLVNNACHDKRRRDDFNRSSFLYDEVYVKS